MLVIPTKRGSLTSLTHQLGTRSFLKIECNVNEASRIASLPYWVAPLETARSVPLTVSFHTPCSSWRFTMTSHPPPRRAWGLIVATALAPLVWGSTYIVASEVLPPGRPLTSAVLRVLPAGLLLLLWLRTMPARSEWVRLLVLSALNIGAFQALLFTAANRLPGGVAAVLGSVQPMVVMLLARWVEGKHITRRAWIAAAMAIAGMATMMIRPGSLPGGDLDRLGLLAALGGAICMGTGTWLGSRWRLRLPLLTLTGWQLFLGGLILVPLALLHEEPLPALGLVEWAGYIYLCLVGALLSYVFWFRGVTLLPPTATSALGLLSPVSAVLLGWLVLSQSFSGLGLVGLFTVLVCVLILQRSAVSK